VTALALLRHGPTAWNAAGRIQGQRDVPLSPTGLAQVQGWRLPPELEGYDWVSSPLDRARATAEALGAGPALALERRLMEARWGDWEGLSLAQLRRTRGPEVAALETGGLDFRAPGGESARDLQARLAPWLAERAKTGRGTLAVTHKGVIRALLALATGWDMTVKPPVRLSWTAVHLFALAADGSPSIDRLNVSLEPAAAGADT